MKTTIEIPADLLQRAKIVAVQRKTTLKELVLQGLEYATSQPAPTAESTRTDRAKKLVAALRSIQIEGPAGQLKRDEIHDRHKGRWE